MCNVQIRFGNMWESTLLDLDLTITKSKIQFIKVLGFPFGAGSRSQRSWPLGVGILGLSGLAHGQEAMSHELLHADRSSAQNPATKQNMIFKLKFNEYGTFDLVTYPYIVIYFELIRLRLN